MWNCVFKSCKVGGTLILVTHNRNFYIFPRIKSGKITKNRSKNKWGQCPRKKAVESSTKSIGPWIWNGSNVANLNLFQLSRIFYLLHLTWFTYIYVHLLPVVSANAVHQYGGISWVDKKKSTYTSAETRSGNMYTKSWTSLLLDS